MKTAITDLVAGMFKTAETKDIYPLIGKRDPEKLYITTWLPPSPENITFCNKVLKDVSRNPLRAPVIVRNAAGNICVEDSKVIIKDSLLVYVETGNPLIAQPKLERSDT